MSMEVDKAGGYGKTVCVDRPTGIPVQPSDLDDSVPTDSHVTKVRGEPAPIINAAALK